MSVRSRRSTSDGVETSERACVRVCVCVCVCVCVEAESKCVCACAQFGQAFAQAYVSP